MSIANFDITTGTTTFESPFTFTDTSFDLSEFNNDSRGTPRVADWNDIVTHIQDENDFDSLLSHLSITINSESLWIGAADTTGFSLGTLSTNVSPNPESDFNYVELDDQTGADISRAFFFKATNFNIGHISQTYATLKKLNVASVLQTADSANRTKQALVYFPNPPGGSGSAIGDPHISTFDGMKYTL